MIFRRAFSSASRVASNTPAGFFSRPAVAQRLPARSGGARAPTVAAAPHTPPAVVEEQSPNLAGTWSPTQQPRTEAMKGPRFEQMDMALQPQPLSAMEMIQREPIRLVAARVVGCDGGDGPLGHPKVFINLDKPGPKACPYCGIRFELDRGHAH
ncbi:hypothetical protein FA09DRAFT_359757 [Tilletiopsis washingtonensis]|uniref:Zinc finger CHCC-type domain-containing protein n=1 Tax=Tilletiopsis washingtonensis TaxID=58919 RepID=A0A316ZC78_9BASI|nr:hypothetical protein FA09DRAFT_359757 [Tilletiopsis washingtonensis]PWN99151.1 hypothetical protein FA09DRAFT_359757 [Tilletiopsis washingtonensis]